MPEPTPQKRLFDLSQILAMLFVHDMLEERCVNHQGPPDYDNLHNTLIDHDIELDEDMCVPGFYLPEDLLALWMGVDLRYGDSAIDLDEAAAAVIVDLEDMLSFTAEAFGDPGVDPHPAPDPPSRANWWGEEERQADEEGEPVEPAPTWTRPSDCGDHRYDEWHIRVNELETQTEYAVVDPAERDCRAWQAGSGDDHEKVYQTALAYLRSKESPDAEEA